MNRATLQFVTNRYWDICDERSIDDQLKWYIAQRHPELGSKSLLQAELEWSRRSGDAEETQCQTLVLLVGFSIEPLLQSVCVHRPQKIALFLNEAGYLLEQPHSFAYHVTNAVKILACEGLLDVVPLFPGEEGHAGFKVEDSPQAVFRKLVEVLRDETDVVIDVTGGKKSMVSGAYLYAAYSGVEISYVDFDKYDPKRRRPYGYTCWIDKLSDPYREFALRDWERVRSLYNRYQFREAGEILGEDILPVMEQRLPNSKDSMKRLVEFMEYYEAWDRGDFREARRVGTRIEQFAKSHKFSFSQPTAVTELGDIWFEIEANSYEFRKIPKGLYGHEHKLKAYVCDELSRVCRLIRFNEDYRSAFLRAGALNEIVMLGRLVVLVTCREERQRLLDALDERTPTARQVFGGLAKTSLTIGKNRKFDISWHHGPEPAITVTNTPMQDWWSQTAFKDNPNQSENDGWMQFLDIRDKLTHRYLSVPRKWAEDAYEFVRANVQDWSQSLGGSGNCSIFKTEALPWLKLCELSGISEFLPHVLKRE